MTAPPLRFRDPRLFCGSFWDDILAVCPRCSACVHVLPHGEPRKPFMTTPRRVVCPQCAWVGEWCSNAYGYDEFGDPMRDPFLKLPLWLQTTCCGQTLWAFNRAHLTLMEQWIRADLREHRRDPKWGWSNQSLLNRLPAWMTDAKNRDAVLRGIARLKRKK